MSKVILCSSKTAETPFTFLNTKVEIYTYEELCFYIFNNTVLITVSSQSVLMPFLLFKKEIKTVFLYHLFDYVDDVPGRPYIENNIESKWYSFCSFPKDLNYV